MDTPVDHPIFGATQDYIVAFGHLKLIKDRISNDKAKKENKDTKKTISSKLPRTVRSITSSSIKPKNIGQPNFTCNAAGTSRQIFSTVKMKTDTPLGGEEKSKPSQIPRRRFAKEVTIREPSIRTVNKNIASRQKPLIEPRNIQRVQLLNINPDFCPESPKPVTIARPIPTLGQIYRQNLSNDTLTDWYLESVGEYIGTSQGSAVSNATVNTALHLGKSGISSKIQTQESSSVNQPNYLTIEDTNATGSPKILNETTPLKIFNSTDENVSAWISLELDQPTKDDESEILLQKRATVVLNKETADSVKTPRCFNVRKVNTDVKLLTSLRSDTHKPLKYPSTPNTPKKGQNFKVPVASYVEYPSEILQKTTNFETDGSGHDNTGQWYLGHEDTCSTPVVDTVWAQLHSPQESVVQSSKTSYSTQESWRENYFGDKNEINRAKSPDKYSHHDYFNHYCWRKEVVKKDIDDECPWDYSGRCKKCQKYRLAPDRKKVHQSFQKLKNRFCRGNYYKGLSRVWKKTTERWMHWSRSTYGCAKLRMDNFKKSLIWDNAHVQTTILVYRETGTDAVAKEQKSAEITTSLKLYALPMRRFSQNGSSKSSTKDNKSSIRHVNIGPSMFPFLYYPTSVLIDHIVPVSHSARHKSENKLKELQNINTLRISKLNNKSNEENRRSISKSTSLIALPSYVLDNGTLTENVPPPLENKVTSTFIHFSDIKLAGTVSQDAYTQMCMTCNNAATDIKYTPPINKECTKITKSTDDEFYYGVDRGTSIIPPINRSQRSIPIMTSKGIMQELTHKETQVTLTPSTKKVSVVLPQEKDAKSIVVTETTVPCRRFESTLVTTKGTILSCTGTKVTSMSSAQIQTASETSKISRGNTVHTGTDELSSFKSEKSTSCAVFKTFADSGVSTSNLVDKASYSGGSCCYTQNSFCTVIHPDCSSVCINTDVELNSKSTGTGISFENRNKSTIDCHAQYSEASYEKSNDTWGSNSRYLARIGRSRLMSVRMLSDSVTEMATQAQPVFQCAETNTAFKQKMSASVVTSRYAIGEPPPSKLQPKDTGPIPTCHCPNTGGDSKTFVAKERRSQALAPVRNDVACKTNSELKSVPRLTTQNGVEARQASSNAEPNFVISSNLNATKWMKGCTKESEKDIQSIISISETMVAESLDRASLVISRSKDRQSINDVKKLSKALINHQPDVSCITATGYHPSSSFSIARMLPTKDVNRVQDQKTFSKHSENDVVIVNKMTSDDNTTTKAIKESIPQLRSNLTDAGTTFDVKISKQQSASVITSRHILPYPPRCSHKCENIDRDCIFIYDRPRCVVHSFSADATVQTELQQRNSEIPFKKHGSMFNRSVGLAAPFSSRSTCSHHNSHNGEVLSPKVYKALYKTTKLIAKEGSESSTQNSSTTVKDESETTTPKSSKTGKGSETTSPKSSKTGEEGYETTTPRSSKTGKKEIETPTPKSSQIVKEEIKIPTLKSETKKEGNITPRIIKTKKEGIETPTPKSSKTRKEGIETPITKSSFTQPICKKTENEDAITASRLQSKAVSQMTSCLMFAPARYCCARCLVSGNVNNRSIQTIAEPLLLCPHCNARLSETNDVDRESMKNQSIQAVGGSLLNCPQCRAKVAVLPHHESAECMQSYLMASCRYYSNLLSIKLAEVKNNFQKYKAPSIEEAMYHAVVVPNNFNRTPTNTIMFTEACTMKPSGRKDENCEAKPNTNQLSRRSMLYQAKSLTDVRGNEKSDLKNVYCILTAIEGRVRRLKSNLAS